MPLPSVFQDTVTPRQLSVSGFYSYLTCCICHQGESGDEATKTQPTKRGKSEDEDEEKKEEESEKKVESQAEKKEEADGEEKEKEEEKKPDKVDEEIKSKVNGSASPQKHFYRYVRCNFDNISSCTIVASLRVYS